MRNNSWFANILIISTICFLGVYIFGCSVTQGGSNPFINYNVPAGEVHLYRGSSLTQVSTGNTALKTAVESSQDNDLILVGSGNYQAGSEITISTDLTIQAANNTSPNNVIIDGEDTYRLFNIPTGRTITFKKITMFDGKSIRGSAIYNNSSQVTLEECIVTSNRGWIIDASSTGGAIYNTGGSLTIQDCIFSNNFAQLSGGAIMNTSIAQNYCYNSTFKNNNAPGDSSAVNCGGGAIFCSDNTQLTCTGNTFENNQSLGGGKGGAIFLAQNSTFTCHYNTYTGNKGTQSGGAIFQKDGVFQGSNNTFTANTAVNWGGAIYITGSNYTSSYNTFIGNVSNISAGGLFCKDGTGFSSNFDTFNGNTSGVCPHVYARYITTQQVLNGVTLINPTSITCAIAN